MKGFSGDEMLSTYERNHQGLSNIHILLHSSWLYESENKEVIMQSRLMMMMVMMMMTATMMMILLLKIILLSCESESKELECRQPQTRRLKF